MDSPAPAILPIGTVLAHPCAECGSAMVLRDSRFGLFYGCAAYPTCKATHGAHKATGEPLGIPADEPTKVERMAAHALFDRLWQGGRAHRKMNRYKAYGWMAAVMGLTRDEAHIGRFNAEQCQRLRVLVVEHFPDLAPAVDRG